jgi:hypothetical protein
LPCREDHNATGQAGMIFSPFNYFNKMRRPEVLFFIAIALGLVLGKLIKNFKVGFFLGIILAIAFAFSFRKRKN